VGIVSRLGCSVTIDSQGDRDGFREEAGAVGCRAVFMLGIRTFGAIRSRRYSNESKPAVAAYKLRRMNFRRRP